MGVVRTRDGHRPITGIIARFPAPSTPMSITLMRTMVGANMPMLVQRYADAAVLARASELLEGIDSAIE